MGNRYGDFWLDSRHCVHIDIHSLDNTLSDEPSPVYSTASIFLSYHSIGKRLRKDFGSIVPLES